jgi:hypothetical protein
MNANANASEFLTPVVLPRNRARTMILLQDINILATSMQNQNHSFEQYLPLIS